MSRIVPLRTGKDLLVQPSFHSRNIWMTVCRMASILTATASRPSATCKRSSTNYISALSKAANLTLVASASYHCVCRDASQIPWGEAGADVICESTGVYTTIDKVGTRECTSVGMHALCRSDPTCKSHEEPFITFACWITATSSMHSHKRALLSSC
jgi:glyceraldehyde-3-phosphate dehydrogenase/erythrose-4-phosphate dehydrogenase